MRHRRTHSKLYYRVHTLVSTILMAVIAIVFRKEIKQDILNFDWKRDIKTLVFILIYLGVLLYCAYLDLYSWLSAHTNIIDKYELFRKRKILISPEEKQRNIERKKYSMRRFRLCFVCHGNICRSPMAEFIMKRLVGDAGLDDRIEICSRAISNEELGNPVYPPAKEELARHGLSCNGKYAVQLKPDDADRYDVFIIMDEWNEIRIGGILGRSANDKVHKLLDFAGGGDVEDPWYTRKFDVAYNDIERGCRGLLEYLKKQLL